MTAAFFAIAKAALFVRYTQAQVDGLNAILAATEGLPITWRAYMLATAAHETDKTMQPIHEYGGPSYFAKYDAGTRLGRILGNTAKGDGARFAGRGYVQLTGRANYTRAALEVGADLIGNPDLAMQPDIAARIMREGMIEGWFTGKRLSDYLPGDYVNARRIINGTDKAHAIAAYAKHFEAALAAIQPPASVETSQPAPSIGWMAWLASFTKGK